MMRARQFVMATFVLIFAAKAVHGHADSGEFVAKITSRLCGTELGQMRGSGIVLQSSGKSRVLTSEHVVYHSNGDYCHFVELPGRPEAPARLVRADWGKGLALLETASDLRGAGPEAFEVEPVCPGGGIVNVGFPKRADGLYRSPPGQLLHPASKSHMIPELGSMIESLYAHAEFGMSGGASLCESSGKILGLISHQQLVMMPGRETKVRAIVDGESVTQNHILVIPAKEVLAWLRDDKAPAWTQDPDDQLRRKRSAVVGGLKFRELGRREALDRDPGMSLELGIGGGGGVGVGGGGGVGVGGGGGVGVGGASASAEAFSGAIEILGIPEKLDQPTPIDSLPWLESVREALLLRSHVFVIGLFRLSPETRQTVPQPIFSLEEFISRALNGGWQPRLRIVKVASSASPDPGALSSEAERMHQAIGRLFELCEDGTKCAAKEERLLLERVETIIRLEVSKQLSDAQRLEAGRLLKDSGWEPLFSEFFEDAVQFYKFLVGVAR